MANTLPDLIGDLYKAAEKVGAEGVGLLNAATINGGSEAVAQGEDCKSVTTEAPTLNSSATPAMTVPEGDDQTFSTKSVTLDQVANVQLNITGEEQAKLAANNDYDSIHGNRFERAFRAIRNQIESYACQVAYQGASRAFGTAGTTPFGSNFSEVAEIRQILFDNGFFQPGEMSLVVNSAAGTNLRQLATLTGVNTAGSSDTLRNGELLNLQGFSIKESAGISSHTKGTGTSYQTSAAEAVGSVTINADTGSGTILAGDIVTFTGDSVNKYVVNSALSGGAFTIGDPGIRSAVADNTALAVGDSYTANVALRRDCVEIVARPMKAASRDAALDVMQVPDPHSGLVYEIREYGGFHKAMWSITVVYAAKVWQPEGVAVLLG